MTNSSVPQWRCWEGMWTSAQTYANPFQNVALRVNFISPSGKQQSVDAFWDGGAVWRARFMPDEMGEWSFETVCTPSDAGLNRQRGTFACSAPLNETRFDRHG